MKQDDLNHSKKKEFTPATWDVFVAYSSPDREVAKRIVKRLEPYLNVFLDVEQIQVGDQWDKSIKNAILTSSVILSIISKRTDMAFFERDEILRAIDRMRQDPDECIIVPVYLDGLSPSSSDIPYGLKPIQGLRLDANDKLDDFGLKIIQRLSEIRPLHFEAAHFTKSIRTRLEAINQEVVELTSEQYRVIQQLRYLKRVRISGSAGSGKTLVAAEKCTRLASSGQHVLFLCHNPLLAEFITTLIPNSGVEIHDFCKWVGMHTDSILDLNDGGWSHYEEPTQEQLEDFLTQLQSQSDRFDAIIVDEAQDFRDEWWRIVETALRSGTLSTLYIFHDNNQSLLPHRGIYPIKEPQIDLSRNCRNAGRIFELMRCFDSSSPAPEQKLKNLGEVSLTLFEAGQEKTALASLISHYSGINDKQDLAVLWSGVEPIWSAPISNQIVSVPACSPWQDEVRWQFLNATRYFPTRGLSLPSQGYGWVEEQLKHLSNDNLPSDNDIRLVQSIANAYSVAPYVQARITKTAPYKFGFHWIVDDSRLTLRRRAKGPLWASELILHFQSDQWHKDLPKPNTIRVVPFNMPQTSDSIPLFSVSDFKGLESDTVILIMRGRITAHRNVVYVGISRARGVLAIAADNTAAADFPKTFKWDRVET